ncbi:DUF4355 domain-containing protein [Companilactobacillus nantensis]|uniref:DUF4355 domain-containing protein n=1 Tax=Companilactobacillus nantensis DSM 16982 TaxID=1423774 RepID=A0A0R1WIK1_9LACO|nr:DUF4355 domain-containing protein [Companilactobacillus nantensis]KRM17269.1 hypothetical protein FD31_GL000348 [Companilactobacillus nantensis DSM 16982]GEO64004.1 hypothetical protein LNA01_11870 [Companilactobacillus nantensis]
MDPNQNKDQLQQSNTNNEPNQSEVAFDDKQQEKVNQLVSAGKAKEKARADQTIKDLQSKVGNIPDLIKEAIAKHDAEANMTDKEKSDAHTQELENQIAKLQEENNRRALVDSASKIAAEKGLPQSFAKLFVGSTDDETQQNLESVKTEFNKAVQESVEERLKGKSSPQTATGSQGTTVNKDLSKMSIDELTEAYMQNPELIKNNYLNK